MAQSGVIVHRKADTFPPNEYWEKVIAENPTAWGAVRVSEVDGHRFLEINSGVDGISLEDIQATLTEFKDQDITFYFCNSEAAVSIKDISPYILLCQPVEEDPEQEEPKLVAFLEGNFPGYAQKDSSHPPEYHLVNDVLIPKFEGLFEMADGDIDKLMENLKKPHFKKELLLTSVSRGTITLVASNGVCLSFAQNDLAREFPWGWTSNHYDFGGTAQKDLPKKKPGMFSRSTVREKANVEPSPAIAEAVKAPETGGAAIKNYTVKEDRPGTHLSRSDKKDWYKSRIGYCPQGWEKSPKVNVYVGPDNKVLTFSQMNKALGLEAAGLIKMANNPTRPGKDVDPDKVESQETLPAESKAVTAAVLPIMSPKSREGVNDIRNKDGYKKIIAENAEAINDPKQAEGYETKFVDFAKQMGVKSMQEFACWDFEMRYELAKSNPQAAATMMDTFANICIRNGYFKDKAVTEQVEETPPKKKPGMFSRSAA